jgi:Mg-chelatase subunit ChlD
MERMAVPDGKPCSKLPASCCSCNKYYTTADGFDHEDDTAYCQYVPETKSCQSGDFMKKNANMKAELVCTKQAPEVRIEAPAKGELKQANRCSNAKFDCGVLHDLFASLWGQMKDLTDETKSKIHLDSVAFETVKSNINNLFEIQSTQLMNLQGALAEATANKASVTDEQGEKQKFKLSTEHLFEKTTEECKTVMREILFTEICGVLAVRNNMIKEHLPDEKAPVDCAVGEWVLAECSVSCDDDLLGGTQPLTREIITKNSKRGFACPALTTTRKCNQIKCPIDCDLSGWATWSKCTKECGGGVQSRTRSLQVQPKNGGQACDALSETRPCNSGSCDKDCELGNWMEFAGCTKACNSGYEERRKKVLSAAEGQGTCVQADDPLMLERKPCNEHVCVGDEMCNSTTDLVIALDGSGSITKEGFDVLKTFAEKLVNRMKSSVRVGVVQFGNGKLDKDRVVSDAIVATDALESDMKSVGGKIQGLVWQKGFTNMAQALLNSKDVLTNGRKGAQSVVLMITDGRPSFKFQTNHAVKSLRLGARLMIVHVQAHRKQEMAELLKGYASEPWSANYIHIPGKKALKDAYQSWATDLIADVCPKLVSPSSIIAECSVTDGSGASSAYPCECGSTTCSPGTVCTASDHFCMPE